ncbi:hypothetical protein B0H19DRAFT_184780 [Mycena capillaripes]|nr:hypothetical protein B0H19DRAFT_184780 [Mycena capillaripes]
MKSNSLPQREMTVTPREFFEVLLFLLALPVTRGRVIAISAALVAIGILELVRIESLTTLRTTYLVDEPTMNAMFHTFLRSSDILAVYIFGAGALFFAFATIRFLILLLWSCFIFDIPCGYSLGKRGEVSSEVLCIRRGLYTVGATIVRRCLWAVWLMLFVAWGNDLFHTINPEQRPLAQFNFGPWLVGCLFWLNWGFQYVWKKLIICVLVRQGPEWDTLIERWTKEDDLLEEIERMYMEGAVDSADFKGLPSYTAEKV